MGWFWASAALGAATHVPAAWDAFTHEGRWGVRALPLLDRRAGGVPLHHWVQYVSSAAGLVATWVWSTPCGAPRPGSRRDGGPLYTYRLSSAPD